MYLMSRKAVRCVIPNSLIRYVELNGLPASKRALAQSMRQVTIYGSDGFICFDSCAGGLLADLRPAPPGRVSDYEWNMTADGRFLDADRFRAVGGPGG